MSIQLNKCLAYLGFKEHVDYNARDDGDGKGHKIKKWYSTQPKPTQGQLQAAQVEVDKAEGKKTAKRQFRKTDEDMTDIVEELFDVLVNEGVLSNSQIPNDMKTKINNRKALRSQMEA
jgi:myosin-crossreactive antigen